MESLLLANLPSWLPGRSTLEVWAGAQDFCSQLFAFLSLTFRGLGLGLLISIPLGVLLSRAPRIASPVLSGLALLQTIPGLALLGFCISVLSIAGGVGAVTAAVIYSVFPIALNTCTGIRDVDPRTIDAARGMGMTRNQILWQVELPLAMPVIMAGVRTGAVYAIGMITVCALAGAGGLGNYVARGMSRGDTALTLLGVLPILVITGLMFWGLGSVAELARKKGSKGLLIGGAFIAVMALYALADPLLSSQPPATEKLDDPRAKITVWQAWQGAEDFTEQASRFVLLMMRGLGVALLVGIPFGIVLTRFPKTAQPVINLLGLIQTVPSLALLGICVSLLPLFGPTAAVFATVVYTLFPLVLNTYVGIRQVDPKVVDAAKGMGLTQNQILWKVEIPLALPVIMAGVRTAATYAISMVTIGALVGARGLGEYIADGMGQSNTALILVGVLPILIVSFIVFWGLSALQWVARKRVMLGLSICGSLIVLLAGYGIADPIFRKRPDVRIGSKDFVESRILAEAYLLLLEDKTDLNVELTPNLGSNFAYVSLLGGSLDLYPEYTGTLLTKKDGLVDLYAEIAKDRGKIEDLVRRKMKERYNVEVLQPFGLDNGHVVVTSRNLAQKHKLVSIGDLKREFRIVMPMEFEDRPDGWNGLRETYNLPSLSEFRESKKMSPSLVYEELLNGKVDVVVGFGTDWQIAVLKDSITVLRDDRNYFPAYLAVPVVRAETLQEYPQIRDVLDQMKARIDPKAMNDEMRRMNFDVIVNRRSVRQVAREFLERHGLLK